MTAILDAADLQQTIAKLRWQLDERTTERDEAIAQQVATAEVLQVINGSPGDLAPVYDAMLDKALRLCDAAFGHILTFDGEWVDTAAVHGEPRLVEHLRQRGPFRLALDDGSSPLLRRIIVGGEQIVQVADALDTNEYRTAPQFREMVDIGGYRSLLNVALRKENVVLGVIVIFRKEVRPFTDKQIALLQNFAAQAVIAMENARLITETQEALDQQTATAEVLQVINASPGDLAPVFDAILEKALALCDAAFGSLVSYDGKVFRGVAQRNLPSELAQLGSQLRVREGSLLHRLIDGENLIEIEDIAASALPSSLGGRAALTAAGARAMLWVALRREDTLVGAINIYRTEIRPFTDKQIALLQNFAAQAVIAMENARLITETREALEQQTATAEVLQIINSSPGDPAPVFDAILEKAHNLCGAPLGSLMLYDGEQFRAIATRGYPEAYEALVRRPFSSPLLDLLLRGEVFQLPDVAAASTTNPLTRAAIEIAGVRTTLHVPLRKDGTLLGYISAQRREVRPFTDKQIALLQNFAAQAVIAMENARLLTETREALDQQTATAEVLQVINSSPGDLTPVFDSMLDKALRLCEAVHGVIRTYDGRAFHEVARSGESSVIGQLRELGAIEPTAGNLFEPLVSGERLIHIADIAAEIDRLDPDARKRVEATGARTWLAIALHKEGLLFGAILVYRQEVRPFSDKQIALLQNFAAQAVIAMENARLITETREALEQQTATAEVLGVINSSPGDLAPVFDAILEKAHTLCGATQGALVTFDGAWFRARATRGMPDSFAEHLRRGFPPVPGSATDQLARGECVHTDNLAAYAAESPPDVARLVQPALDLAGTRTILMVPLRKDDALLGYIAAYRQEVRPFTDKQIALLQNFAAQAVIAMENARLITETREALEQQTATAEVLQVINSSPGDLAPVFDAMLEKALRLCDADFGTLWTFDGERFHPNTVAGFSNPAMRAMQASGVRAGPNNSLGRVMAGESIVHVLDVNTDPGYRTDEDARTRTRAAGTRTVLAVALRKDDRLLGAISTGRRTVRAYTDKQIALLQNFAAQAVIAMENARLITETREALEQQTATSEVLQVINASPGDLAPVFDAILEKAHSLCEAAYGVLWTYDGEAFHASALQSVPQPYADFISGRPLRPLPGGRGGLMQIADGADIAHFADAAADEAYRDSPVARAVVELGGARTMLVVALRKDATLLGAITSYRQEVRPFTDKQIALLQNFAAQAVIAMENARLLTETREALEQQTATAEVLQVINSSPGDLAPVFDAILEKAHTLCDAPRGSLNVFDGEFFRAVATRGLSEAYAALLREGIRGLENPWGGPLLAGERFVHTLDVREAEPERIHASGTRTLLAVPLRKGDVLLGMIMAARTEVRPFTEKQIALLQNFAAQAVIAMENARLINETREALEQQTATAEVLQVINSSPGDLAPVFDAMLDKALRLCEATHGNFVTYDGDAFHPGAFRGEPRFAEYWWQQPPFRPAPGNPLGRMVRGERVIHDADAQQDDAYRESPSYRRIVDLGGIRASLMVPLRREGALLGAIRVYRREVRPFTDKQIALLQNFAAQAVIAMENARLITETREALEQQTATAEVLGVINSSPGDLTPVFDAILEKAHSLCGVAHGSLQLFDGEAFRAVALHGHLEAMADELRRPRRPLPNSSLQPLLDGHLFAQVDDIAAINLPDSRNIAKRAGMRTVLYVALRKETTLLGFIAAGRDEIRRFSDKEIALLQNFAAQAVIAMENARLITETREALDQQTATAEVLGVINASPGDLAPVFDAMLDRATRLSEAAFGILWTYDGERFHARAFRNVPPAYAEFLREPLRAGPETGIGRLARGETLAHIPDIAADEVYQRGGPLIRQGVALAGFRTVLAVPMRKDDVLLGAFTIYRQEASSFSDKQIALLQNFAAQAVIAMENARLLGELQQRTGDLQESLEYQTATAEVLRIVASSPDALQPVFEAMLERATALCGANSGTLHLYDAGTFTPVASRHPDAELTALVLANPFRPGPTTAISRMAETKAPVHIPDLAAEAAYLAGDPFRVWMVERVGQRALLAVPLLKGGSVVGAFVIYRLKPEPFSNNQIALVTTFADQAVIAIENARLLDEIRQRQAELRVTFDNMADGVVMFDEGLRLAAWNRNFQELLDLPDAVLADRPSYTDYLRILAERGEFGTGDIEAELSRRLERADQEFRMERTRPDGRVIEVRRNSVPDGGFVLIYSDITERKRSEAEIRAARDAAEATLRDLRAAQANLIQAEKMASLGQLTAGIAHEIKNPLNFVNNFADLSGELLKELKEAAAPGWAALDEDKRAEIDETMVMLTGNLEKIGEHGRRADGIVKSMLEHSRGVTSERRVVDLNNLIEEALNLAYHGARAQDQTFNIRMDRDFDRDLARIELVPQEMSRVFINLFGNGFYAATKRQRDSAEAEFQPTLTVATRDLGEAVEVRVRDNGTGIPAEIKDMLFQPFFTTKPTGEGTGLGLSISYDIVTQQHGGTIEVDSRVGEFTEFTIRLPRGGAPQTGASA